MEKLLSIREAAELLNLKVPTLYKKVCRKTIPYTKLGGRLLFESKKLEAYVRKNSFEDQSTAKL